MRRMTLQNDRNYLKKNPVKAFQEKLASGPSRFLVLKRCQLIVASLNSLFYYTLS